MAGKTAPPLVRKVLSVGEVAARSGLAVSAIHFYEAQGLIRSSRTAGNQRRYPREILRRVAVIKVAQRIGIPLSIIREALLTLPRGRTPTGADWKKLSSAWKATLDERIDKLVRLRGSLNECIGCGCLSLKVCPLRNPADVLGDEGPGPRLLDPAGGAPVAGGPVGGSLSARAGAAQRQRAQKLRRAVPKDLDADAEQQKGR
jgi:MerR family transcriptional regulator, redox-sensitive transcriptional activator SoxR